MNEIKDFFKLSNNCLKFLFIYFGILIIIGLFITIISINYTATKKSLNITQTSLLGGIGTSILGASFFYIRKLYKSAIKNIFSEPTDRKEKLREIGLIVYYLLRPIFGIIFSLILHIGLKASVAIVTVKESDLDVGMIYLTMLISFFIGFSTGDLIDKVEVMSKDIATKTFERFS